MLSVTAADHGKTVDLHVGQSLSVSLEGNRTTGYSWSFIDNGEPVVTQPSTPTVASESYEPRAVGMPEVTTWTFVAQTPGEAPLKLEYRRPWEKESEPAQTFELTIRVTE